MNAFGAGMNQAEILAERVRNTDMDVLMLAGRYTLLAAVVSVCFGARSPQQIGRNAELFRAPLPATLWAELKTAGLMREDDAPV